MTLFVEFVAENHPPVVESATTVNNHKRSEESDKFDDEEFRSPKENGEQRSNGYKQDARCSRNEDRQPDVVEDHRGKSRSPFNSSPLVFMLTDSCWYFIES